MTTLHGVGYTQIPTGAPNADELNSDRTSELRKKGYEGRRLGPVQMTTDTAVRVTRMVVHDRGRQTTPGPYVD